MELVVSSAPAAASLLSTGGDAPVKAAPVASQTSAIGIINPPPDIRSIVDKTAQFVARNGPEFEKRILANERNNVKFNFLVPGDPYHAYYQHKVAAFKTDDAGTAKEPAVAAKGTAANAEAAPERIAVQTATNFKPVVLEAPEKEQYTIALPDGISAFDLDVIKLTAQFVARNGKSFLTGLTSREHLNPQFNFLKPTHSMFTFFTALADAYSKVLMPPKSLNKRLQSDASDKPAVLDRCLKRLEWERTQERARKEAEDKAEAERDAMASIDWHDFVVVETIDFYNKEDDSLPAPLSLPEVIAQLRASAIEAPAAAEAQVTAMDVEMDEEERALMTDGVAAQQQPPQPAAPAPEPQMKIVRNYKRPGQAASGPDSVRFVVSPITGELVPVDQMAEHMRISLIDPKWREQREAMLGKLRGSTVASDEEIAKNVISLARTRPDIFGSTDEEVSVAVAAEAEAKKTAGFEHHASAPLPPPSSLQPLRPPAGMPMPPRPYGAPGMPMVPLGYPGPGMPGMPPPGMPGLPPPGMPGMPPPGMPGMPPPGMPGMPGMPPRPLGAPPGMMPYPPPMPYGAPMMAAGQLPPMSAEEPDAKRQRTEDALMSEEDFAEAHPDPVTIEVTVPAVDGDATMTGQTVSVEVASVMETVGDVKARLAALLGVAASKQKLSTAALGFLKDTSTLAAYNFGSGTAMVMGLKERGGRTKK